MNNHDRKTVIKFATASALNDIGSEIVRPFWPVFVTSVLGAPMTFLGFVDGLGDALSNLIRFPAGYLSDKFGKRKIFIWLGYLLAGLSRIGYALSMLPYHLIPFKAMDRLGKLRDPPRDAMLSEISAKRRGKYFGILTAADNFGAALGPVFAFLLFSALGYRSLFLLAAVPSLLSASVILFGIREKFLRAEPVKFHINTLSRRLVLLILISALFALSWFSISFMVVFVSSYIPIAFAPLLFIVMNISASLVSIPVGRLSDRIGRKKLLAAGYFLFGLVCAGFIFFVPSLALVMAPALFALYGVHYGIVTTLQSPFVSDMSKKETRASVIGLFQTVFGICSLPASIIAGVLWDSFSRAAPFYYGLVLSLASTFLLLIFVKEKQ